MNKVETRSIPIRPESDVYSTYRRLAYKMWYAIGEFVDNSTQNFFDHNTEIRKAAGHDPVLTIDVVYDLATQRLSVGDDANGMNEEEVGRAVRLNCPPADRRGRSEFGMGLKMAACWLGSRWRIVTKRLGSTEELEVLVDVTNLERQKPECVDMLVRPGCDPTLHYTRIEIEDLYRRFRGRAVTSLREHLSSIYRRDINSGGVVIKWNGDPLTWDDDPVFEQELPGGGKQPWRKPVAFSVDGHVVKGDVWIRMPGQARRAGFHLFRRGRLVLGGPGEGYKPEEIFGAPNSFQSQRLVGELDLDDWPVTQTKDAFDWAGDLEHEFIAKLREASIEYADQCEKIKSDEIKKPTKADAQLAADATKDSLSTPAIETAMLIVETGPPPEPKAAAEEAALIAAIVQEAGEPTRVRIGTENLPELDVWFVDNLPESELYAQFACPTDDVVQLAVNLNHPFVTNILKRDPEMLQLWAQMLYVDALVERGARKRGGNLPPNAYREFKDAFLRRIRCDHP